MQELACLQRSPTYGLALLDLALARVTFLSLSQSTRGHMLGSSSAWHRQLRSLPATLLHLDSPASRLPGRESGCDRLPRIEKVSATPPHLLPRFDHSARKPHARIQQDLWILSIDSVPKRYRSQTHETDNPPEKHGA